MLVARPFRVPLSTRGCVIALIPTIATLILVIALASYTTICVNFVIIVAGTSIYALVQMQHEKSSPKLGFEALLVERNREFTALV